MSIIIIEVETIVVPSMDFVKKGVLLGFVTKLSSGLGGVSAGRNLNRSLALLVVIVKVVGRPQMVFTNPITITHVNKTIDRPLVSSMAAGGYKSADVMNLKRGYR